MWRYRKLAFLGTRAHLAVLPPYSLMWSAAFRADCLNVKSEERVVYKRLNSTATLIQKTTREAPHETLCITSDWMFTRRRSATA